MVPVGQHGPGAERRVREAANAPAGVPGGDCPSWHRGRVASMVCVRGHSDRQFRLSDNHTPTELTCAPRGLPWRRARIARLGCRWVGHTRGRALTQRGSVPVWHLGDLTWRAPGFLRPVLRSSAHGSDRIRAASRHRRLAWPGARSGGRARYRRRSCRPPAGRSRRGSRLPPRRLP